MRGKVGSGLCARGSGGVVFVLFKFAMELFPGLTGRHVTGQRRHAPDFRAGASFKVDLGRQGDCPFPREMRVTAKPLQYASVIIASVSSSGLFMGYKTPLWGEILTFGPSAMSP